MFDDRELELLISGLPTIDVEDWKRNTVYVNYTKDSDQIVRIGGRLYIVVDDGVGATTCVGDTCGNFEEILTCFCTLLPEFVYKLV